MNKIFLLSIIIYKNKFLINNYLFRIIFLYYTLSVVLIKSLPLTSCGLIGGGGQVAWNIIELPLSVPYALLLFTFASLDGASLKADFFIWGLVVPSQKKCMHFRSSLML